MEVAHEALLRKWPLLEGWLDETREYLLGSQQLETELAQWQQAPDTDKETALVSGLKLSHAQAWLEERPQQFGSDLQAFVRASMAHRDRAATQRRLGLGPMVKPAGLRSPDESIPEHPSLDAGSGPPAKPGPWIGGDGQAAEQSQ